MNVCWLQHVPFEGNGYIAEWLQDRAHAWDVIRLYDDEPLPELSKVDMLIIMGGPMSIYDDDQYPYLPREKAFIRAALAAGKMVIGICLGAQLIADALGAKVYPNPVKEIGWWPVQFTAEARAHPLFHAFPPELPVFHWHGDTFDLPAGAMLVASSAACRNQAFLYGDRVIGLQFHLEIRDRGVRDLIEHCGHEIVDAPYIQPAEQMRWDKWADDDRRFDIANQRMMALLMEFEFSRFGMDAALARSLSR
jgi:GMP synthase-like glutamine amidotransferase